MQAAITIIRAEGRGALTTVRITDEAGIAQPRFYRYFDNVDQLLEAAAATVVSHLADGNEVHLEAIENPADASQLAKLYLKIFDEVEREGVFYELAARYRHHPSELGERIRESDRKTFDHTVEHLLSAVKRPTKRQKTAAPHVASMIYAAIDGAIARLISEPDIDRKHLASELAEFVIGGTKRALHGPGVGIKRKARSARSR